MKAEKKTPGIFSNNDESLHISYCACCVPQHLVKQIHKAHNNIIKIPEEPNQCKCDSGAEKGNRGVPWQAALWLAEDWPWKKLVKKGKTKKKSGKDSRRFVLKKT